jgi:hypothetical protein
LDASHVLGLFMFSPNFPTSDPDPDRTAERFAMLRRLADGGMEIAQIVLAKARAAAEADPAVGEPQPSVTELALAYSRVARAVRQTLALEVKFVEGPRSRDPAGDIMDRWKLEMESAGEKLRAKLAAVGLYPTEPLRMGESDDEDFDDSEYENLADRPDDDPEGFSSGRPPRDVLAGVCADLGIERDLSIWDDEKPLPPCGEGVGGVVANHSRPRTTPTPDPSPHGGGEMRQGPAGAAPVHSKARGSSP